MSHKQVLQLAIAVILVISFLVGCGESTPTAVSEAPAATSEPEQPVATPTPEPPTITPIPKPPTETPTAEPPPPTPTSTILTPDGLLPSTITPVLFESLYQQAISKASQDIPDAIFDNITVVVDPFGSPSSPDPTIIECNFRKEGAIYSYEWDNETNELVFEGKTAFIISSSDSSPKSCNILPWQREVGWEELVRYGYFRVHDSFPSDANSRYILIADFVTCSWYANFIRFDSEGGGENLGTFFLDESGPRDF
jgi:hypothetical protein